MKFSKKFLSLLLALAMLLSITAGLSLTAYAEIFEYGDFNYMYLDDGTVEIQAYRGDNPDLVFPEEIDGKKVSTIGGFITSRSKVVESIVIPDSVTEIKASAFSSLKTLTSVKFSKNITKLPRNVFNNCISLETIVIPDNVTMIDERAFASCKSLKNVTIPDSVTTIEGGIFDRCTNLEEIVLPNGITEVPWSAFFGCTNLKEVIIPDTVTRIENDAFRDCTSLESIKIPDSVTRIDSSAFRNCLSLKSFTFPVDMTDASLGIFEGCTSLTDVAFPYEQESFKWDSKYSEYVPNLKEITMFSRICDFTEANVPSDITIYGFENSTAQSYAKENGNEFITLGEEKLDTPKANLIVNKNGTFLISWSYIAGAGSYEVYMYDYNKNAYKLKYTTEKTAIKTEVMEYVHTYDFKVRAVSAANRKFVSDFSNEVSGMNDKMLLAPVPQITANTDGSFTLSWNDVFVADAYEIYLVNADGSNHLLQTVASNSATISDVPYGETYTYKVRALGNKNGKVVSDYSQPVSATNNSKLQAPTANVFVNTNGSFTISWNAVSGADKYEVYYNNGAGYKLLRTVTGTSATTAVAAKDKTYSYKVRAVTNKNSSATSNYSNVVNATNAAKLQTPTAKVTVNTNGSFTVSWNPISRATKYDLYYDNGTGYKFLYSTTATSFTTAVAARGKTYNYKVRAVTNKSSLATSDFSNVVSATNNTKLQTPTAKVTVNANGSFNISWNSVSGADKYEVYYNSGTGYKLLRTTTGTSTTTAVAVKGKTYSYKVRAVTNKNSSATSDFSKDVSATRK